ncbi:cyclin-like protein [Aspergillus ambiguus]|uniref:cyclin family protein n=1 Tax=Aspergillus ambiguus TaxID=176160 RepID=UPI003CCD9947
MASHKCSTWGSRAYDPFSLEFHIDSSTQFMHDMEEAEPPGQIRQNHAFDKSHLSNDDFRRDMLPHMLSMEMVNTPDVELIDIQPEIQWCMRSCLLDFLIEVHGLFQCTPSPLFLAINILDRYCSRHIVRLEHYQLVGCTAFLLATKYREKKDSLPTINELRSMCGFSYDKGMFLDMEWHMLDALDWMIGRPTIDDFLLAVVTDIAYDCGVMHMALYISEISQYHRAFVSQRPSDLARAALALAQVILNGYHLITECALQYDARIYDNLFQYVYQPSRVLRRKYASSNYSNVAKTLEIFLAEQMPASTYMSYISSFAVQDRQANVIDRMETIWAKPTFTSIPQITALPTPPITPE